MNLFKQTLLKLVVALVKFRNKITLALSLLILIQFCFCLRLRVQQPKPFSNAILLHLHTYRAGLDTATSKIREELIAQFCTVLAIYRKHCAAPSSPGQLILPECMKLIPTYINCLTKVGGHLLSLNTFT